MVGQGDCPETGFEELWAGSAFDGSKLPIMRLLGNFSKADPMIGCGPGITYHMAILRQLT